MNNIRCCIDMLISCLHNRIYNMTHFAVSRSLAVYGYFSGASNWRAPMFTHWGNILWTSFEHLHLEAFLLSSWQLGTIFFLCNLWETYSCCEKTVFVIVALDKHVSDKTSLCFESIFCCWILLVNFFVISVCNYQGPSSCWQTVL